MYSFWALYIVKDDKPHYLEIDDATEISYEWLSPMWNTETSTTWDFSLPRTPYNEELLLPSSDNGELIPLNEGRLQGYLTGLPWQETDEAYWGLLTVLSATERRIKVQFLQKSLFEQKLERPVREIKVSVEEHRVEDLSSVWATGEEWKEERTRRGVIISWEVITLLKQFALWGGYTCKSNLDNKTFYLVSNLYNSFKCKMRTSDAYDAIPFSIKDIRENGEIYYNNTFLGKGVLGNLDDEDAAQSLQSSRIALGLVRELLRLFCAQMLITEYVQGSNKTPRVTYRGVYSSSARRYFGELSSYEWVKTPYPELQDVAERLNKEFSLQERNYLFPIIAMEDYKGLEFREYKHHKASGLNYCFYNDVVDGAPFEYSSECKGRTFYPPWPDEFPYYYAYFQYKDYSNPVTLVTNSHLCDCTPTGVAVSTSQYGVDREHGTWKYLGEYLQTRLPHVHGRGAQRVALPFQRGRFIAITLDKDKIYTYGDTLLNSCTPYIVPSMTDWSDSLYFDRDKTLKAQDFDKPLSVRDFSDKASNETLLRTVFKSKSFLTDHLKKKHTKPPKPYDPPDDNLPLPPGKDWDDDRRPHRPIPRKLFTQYSMHSVSALQSVEDLDNERKQFHDTWVKMTDKQKLFYAFSIFYINNNPPLPCIEVDPYDPTKPRAERLFIAGLRRTDFRVERDIHPNAYRKLPYEIRDKRDNPDKGTYYEDSLTNDLPLEELVLPYFQHLWHAVEGELSSWEEDEVFKYITEFNYPKMDDASHIGNQRIKRVTMLLRRNECRIKSVRVIQFNRLATKEEFNKFLQ